jgi:hypothetical protein
MKNIKVKVVDKISNDIVINNFEFVNSKLNFKLFQYIWKNNRIKVANDCRNSLRNIVRDTIKNNLN